MDWGGGAGRGSSVRLRDFIPARLRLPAWRRGPDGGGVSGNGGGGEDWIKEGRGGRGEEKGKMLHRNIDMLRE